METKKTPEPTLIDMIFWECIPLWFALLCALIALAETLFPGLAATWPKHVIFY